MYRLVYLSYLLMTVSAGVTFVFLEDFESRYGLPAWGIGLISAITFLSFVFISLAVAPLADRGHLRILGWAGFLLAIIGNLWIGFADELWSLSVSRGFASIGTGIFSVVGRKALIGEATTDGGEKIGTFLSAAVAGFIIGPSLGAQLSELGDIETPYLLIAGLLIVIALPTMSWLSAAPVAISERIRTREMLPLLKLPGMRAAVAAHVALLFNIGVFDSTVDEYLTDLGVSNSQVGLILIAIGIPLLILPRFTGRWVDRAPNPARIMLAAVALFVPIVLTLGLWVGVAVFVVLACLQTLAESVIFPSTARVVLDETGAEKSAIGTGLLEAVGSTAAAISAFAAPVLYDLTDGPLFSFGMSGVVAFALFVVAAVNVQRRDRDGAPVAVRA